MVVGRKRRLVLKHIILTHPIQRLVNKLDVCYVYGQYVLRGEVFMNVEALSSLESVQQEYC